MTGMPEAALARELELEYATCSVVANRAAGRNGGTITMKEIEIEIARGMEKVAKILEQLVKLV
jgi:purine nucleoside phosphorylase